MPATYTAHHRLARADRRMVRFNPGTTVATLVTLDRAGSGKCLPIALFREFLVGLMRSIGTGTVSSFSIVAATSAAGAGATVVSSHPLGTAPDAVGDTIYLEVNAEQIREVLPAATHVGVQIALATGTDECVIYYEGGEPYFPVAGLTADIII